MLPDCIGQAHLVTDVGEPGVSGSSFCDECEGFVEVHVHRVFQMVQGAGYQVPGADDFCSFRFGYCLYIGDIGQVAKTESEDGQSAVQYLDRLHFDMAYIKRYVFVEGNEFDTRRTRNGITENIFKAAAHLLCNPRQSVHRHRTPGAEIKRAHIIESDDVVVVFVREQDAIDVANTGAQHLLPEIGACIYNNIGVAIAEQCRRPQSVVARVAGSAHFAVAPDNGDALRSAGAEECNFQGAMRKNDTANISKNHSFPGSVFPNRLKKESVPCIGHFVA